MTIEEFGIIGDFNMRALAERVPVKTSSCIVMFLGSDGDGHDQPLRRMTVHFSDIAADPRVKLSYAMLKKMKDRLEKAGYKSLKLQCFSAQTDDDFKIALEMAAQFEEKFTPV